jgi:kumamolisin
VLDVSGTVEDIEKALYLNLNYYLRPDASEFWAPDREPSLDLTVPLLFISGLNDFAVPLPAGLGLGLYQGKDYRTAYAACADSEGLDGSGQCIGIASWAPFNPQDIADYRTFANLPSGGTVEAVGVGGFDTSGPVKGNGDTLEVSADVEMAMSMAPAADVVVYEGDYYAFASVIAAMADDGVHALCHQLSLSFFNWTRNTTTEPTTLQILSEWMPLRGQSFFWAAGDDGAFHDPGGVPTVQQPEYNYVTLVGGTVLEMSPDKSTYLGESVWPRGGGGIWSPFAIPDYQVGIDMSNNGGSVTSRNLPDVAMVAQDVTVVATVRETPDHQNLDLANPDAPVVPGEKINVGGTSLGAPLWAGFTALVNQWGTIHGYPPVGFANPTLYAIGKTPELYGEAFHDIKESQLPPAERVA